MSQLGCDALVIGPAPLAWPGPDTGGISSSATHTLLSADALAFAARVIYEQRRQMKDKSYRSTPVGGEVGRYLRSLKWSDSPANTTDTYEIALARLAYDHAHFQSLEEFTTEIVRDFLDHHWGDAAPATRRGRLAAVRSFFTWAVDERGLQFNPATRIKPPRKRTVDRQAYKPDLLEQLRRSQPTLRDQICVQMLARLGLRKDELRLLQVKDFDLGNGTFLVHGKGGKVAVMPIGFQDLKTDLELHLIGRDPGEYLLYPKTQRMRAMNQASVHRWLKKCLERAGLPDTIKTHELRHSAADNLWRQTGNLIAAQQLLRHESVKTTQDYLHPTRDDLADTLAKLEVVRSDDQEMA